MGMLYCSRCDALKDSKDGDTVIDPADASGINMCCVECLNDGEAAWLEASAGVWKCEQN